MPAVTRSIAKKLAESNSMLIRDTLENPFVLSIISTGLDTLDLVNLKLVSKDEQFNQILSSKLNSIKIHKERTNSVVCTTSKLMNEFSKAKGLDKRLSKLRRLFEFLLESQWFLNEHQKFKNAVEQKLFSFIAECEQFAPDAVKYLCSLFDLKQPTYYFNSKIGKRQYGMFDTQNIFKEIPIIV